MRPTTLTATIALGLATSLGIGAAAAPAASHHSKRKHHTAKKHGRSSKSRKPVLKLMWGPNTLPDGTPAFDTYKRLKVDVLQEQLNWARIASQRPADPTDPDDPAYHWPQDIDTAVDQATERGIKIAFMVKETPPWANGGEGVDRVPNDDGDYADFLTAAARRYSNVRYWMIWGEPTRKGNFSPMPANKKTGPRRYAKLLDRAYGALKAVRRSNIVIGGNTWTVGEVKPPTFVKWLRLPNGKPPRMDYWGHNPYSTRFPDLKKKVYYPGVRDISDIDTLHHEIARAYKGRKVPKLWLSEFSIASDRANRAFAFYVTRKEQAHWLSAAYKLVNETSYVAGLGWYDLYDQSPATSDSLTNGLMTASGQPKPSFDAYRRAR